MLRFVKKHAGVCYIALMTIVVAIVLLCTDDVESMLRTLLTLDARWVAASAGCILLYLLLRVATLRWYLHRRGYSVRWRDAIAVSGAGQFYSAITPSASGGQPMQVLYLYRRGVPVSMGTACVCVKFLGFQAAMLSMGAVLWMLNPQIVTQQLYGFRWFVVLGFLLNIGLLGVVALTIFQLNGLKWCAEKLANLGARLHIVRDPENAVRKMLETLSDYRQAMLSIAEKPLDALALFALSLLQVVSYMSVPICLYHAFGCSGVKVCELLTMQSLLFIAAAFIPLPGAAGAQESGFMMFFRNIFPSQKLTAAMVCWRFFTYYLLLIMGALMTVIGLKKHEAPSLE